MDKILSIIVPTYNMERYLDKCLTSLIVGGADHPLMQALEVFVVNDGSTDKSSEIAHRYESAYPETFRVIDKENRNYGSCINRGLAVANGKYIKVLDADDWFDTAHFKSFITKLSKIDVDVVFNDFEWNTIKNKEIKVISFQIPSDTILPLDALSSYENMWMHTVTYRTGLFRTLNYHQSEGLFYTDQEWIFLPLSASKTIYYIPGVLYHYLYGREGQSVSPQSYKNNFWMELKGLQIMVEQYRQIKDGSVVFQDITFSTDYLLSRILTRCHFIYKQVLINRNQIQYYKQLIETDNFLRLNHPELYSHIEKIVYPTKNECEHAFRAHYIRTWHRYGMKICRIQLFFINHFLGILYRIKRK